MENSKDSTVMDVRSVVEAVSTDDDDAPVYQVESLCMRCGENVSMHAKTHINAHKNNR